MTIELQITRIKTYIDECNLRMDNIIAQDGVKFPEDLTGGSKIEYEEVYLACRTLHSFLIRIDSIANDAMQYISNNLL